MVYRNQAPRYRRLIWDTFGEAYLYDVVVKDGDTLRVRWPSGREQTLRVRVVKKLENGEDRVFVPVIVHGLRAEIEVKPGTDLEFIWP